MLKRISSLLLAGAMLVSISGCTLNNRPANTNDPINTSTSQPSDKTPMPTPNENEVYNPDEWTNIECSVQRIRTSNISASKYNPVIIRSVDELKSSQYYNPTAEAYFRIYNEEFFASKTLVLAVAVSKLASTFHELQTASIAENRIALVFDSYETNFGAKNESREIVFAAFDKTAVEQCDSVTVFYGEAKQLGIYKVGTSVEVNPLKVKNEFDSNGIEVIHSIEELKNMNLEFFASNGYEELKKYDEEFFKENYLLASHVYNPSATSQYSGFMLYVYENNVVKFYVDTADSGSMGGDFCYSIMFVPLSKSYVTGEPEPHLTGNISFDMRPF